MYASDLNCDRRTTVAVRPGLALDRRPHLFAALEAAVPVSFVAAESLGGAPVPTIVFADPGRPFDAAALAAGGAPLLAIGEAPAATARPTQTVTFGERPEVDPRVRGIAVADRLDGPGLGTLDGGARTLATGPSGPAWVECGSAGTPLHLVSSALPELGEEQILRDLFADRALALVALLHFLRTAGAADAFAPPPLRAAFLFDDPNLRWRTYGFIDYARLAEHAADHGYHAAMAMVPLDGRLQHPGTVDLFRRNPERLSLVFHGNNHVSQELMRPSSEPDALALAAQARRRAERFGERYGLRFDRVMTPPHGMCSADVARALGAVGFDGLCAIHPLPWAERPPAGRSLAGCEPAEFAEGCAVIPRLHLGSTDADIGLRAFLGHPLVFYGHHEDLADGLERLAAIAARVGRMGPARWCSLGEIAASNFAARDDGDTVRVRPYSNRVRVPLPAGSGALVVERPRDAGGRLCGWSIGAGPPTPFGAALPVAGGAAVEVRLRRTDEASPDDVPAPRRRPWPVLRKVAMEARDRALPLRS